GTPDANFTGPAIKRLANGSWHYRRVGLLGGMDNELSYQATDMVMNMRPTAELNPQISNMPFNQQHALAEELLRRTTPAEANTIFTTMTRSTPDATLTTAQLRLWDEALAIASGRSPSAANSSAPTGLAAAASPTRSVRYAKLTDAQWPDHVYVYMSSSELNFSLTRRKLYLSPKPVPGGSMAIPVTTLPPETPWHTVPRQALISPRPMLAEQPHSIGSSASAWIRIDTRGLRSLHPDATLSRIDNSDLFILRRGVANWVDLDRSFSVTLNTTTSGTPSGQPLPGIFGTP
ncbi:hypothetical protein, partial [Luteibacter sp. UNCMF366Tsu5.1]|uniref:hypothetical protein n=1 Tax=Luteibacter sp. UNCMF366Tsu5.1 TaxID=1502758 RepID=UPI0009089793